MENKNLARTGDKCPQSGEWVALEDGTSSFLLKKGEEMPSYRGRSISWQLKKTFS
jgi:hypothetical protein